MHSLVSSPVGLALETWESVLARRVWREFSACSMDETRMAWPISTCSESQREGCIRDDRIGSGGGAMSDVRGGVKLPDEPASSGLSNGIHRLCQFQISSFKLQARSVSAVYAAIQYPQRPERIDACIYLLAPAAKVWCLASWPHCGRHLPPRIMFQRRRLENPGAVGSNIDPSRCEWIRRLPPSQLSDSSSLSAKRKRVADGAKILLDVAKETSDWFPPLKSALGGVSALIKHYEVLPVELVAAAHN